MYIFKNLHKKHLLLIAVWFVINVLQSIFTGLHSDESYYWMYAQHLDWGFFDHPPMVALLINMGYSLFQNELGVRLFIIILSSISIAIIVNEINEQKDFFFLCLFVLSFPLIHTHIGGFLALPDIPLIFFTLLFFILYREFTEKPGLNISLLLSVVIAAMVYSKYHAVLIVFFTVLSNLKLLRNRYFWLIVVVSLLLLSPHIWWQYQNDFPTLRYHLFERAKSFRLKYILLYIAGQLAIAGPLTGVIVFWKLRKFRAKNIFDRAVIFNILGFYTVFFILSSYNRIEAHWTAAIIPLLMIASYPLISNDSVSKKWFKRLSLPVIILFFLFRVYLAVDAIPDVGHLKITFYKRGDSAREIQQMAKGKKVGFFDNYAATSNYIFYTGEQAVLLSNPGYRFCQYDLWDDEAYAEGDSLFIVIPKRMNPPAPVRLCNGQMIGFMAIGGFQSLKGLMPVIKGIGKDGGFLKIIIQLRNNSSRSIQLRRPSSPSIGWKQGAAEVGAVLLSDLIRQGIIIPGGCVSIKLNIPLKGIDTGKPLVIYTRTSENNRGEIITVPPKMLSDRQR
ncbi:hypothetical protein MNBD_BACTEROID01-916 [hydrothermal vent metagenome]|uniref:Glycosyltransferase RgtA/B/C/D-like domain-containing protein n=1 Tax=hydrothermal vent metagenome TaxID=652676 RepID=A0A3B0TID5_9ZZZZ